MANVGSLKSISSSSAYLDEEVIRDIVDVDGYPTNQVDYGLDSSGRQRISFFLKSVKANDKAPTPARFKKGGDDGMETASFEDAGSEASSARVDEVRYEMNYKLDKMALSFKSEMETMQNMFRGIMSDMQQQQQQQREQQQREEQIRQHQQQQQQQQQAYQQQFAAQVSQAEQEAAEAEAIAALGSFGSFARPDPNNSGNLWIEEDVLEPMYAFGEELEDEIRKFESSFSWLL